VGPDAATIELDAQYRELRESCGVLERRERATLSVLGGDGAEYLQGQLTSDIEALEPGSGGYSALLDRKGHMQADLRVLRISAGEIWLDTEEAALPAVLRHLQMYSVGRDVEIADTTGERAILSLIGPAASEVSGLARGNADDHREAEVGGIACRAVTTEDGIDLICAQADAEALRKALLGTGAAAVSAEAAEILRIEAGVPRFGAEMTTSTMPAEAGIVERAVSFTKGCYIGQETVARLHYKGRPNRHLRALRLTAPAAAGDELRLGEKEVGVIGSATVSPALGPIGLAIVRREAEPGTTLAVGDGGVSAEVVELPPRTGEPAAGG
jgi:folate-binding protein YgfZ